MIETMYSYYIRSFCRVILVFVFLYAGDNHPEASSGIEVFYQARSSYRSNNYSKALSLLDICISQHDVNTGWMPNALFYYARTAHQLGNLDLADRVLAFLGVQFPNWSQLQEIYYWRGILAFENHHYDHGLSYLKRVQLKSRVEEIKYKYLSQIKDIHQLQLLLQRYPKDPIIQKLVEINDCKKPIICQSNSSLLHHARQIRSCIPKRKLGVKKQYNIAVFLPLFVGHETADPETDASTSFAMSIYQGIVMAVESLNDHDGAVLQLLVFDTQKCAERCREILCDPVLKHVDLIIGPLYEETFSVVAPFAAQHQINLWNPLSENLSVVGKNPFVYLGLPSRVTQAKKAAMITLQNQPTRIGIVYTEEDMEAVNAYRQVIEENIGIGAITMLPMTPDHAKEFLQDFREMQRNPKCKPTEIIQQLQGISHLYIASRDELIASNILVITEMMKLQVSIIGQSTWLDKDSISWEQLQNDKLYLIGAHYMEPESSKAFQENFYSRWGVQPNIYAEESHNLMCYLGQELKKYGKYSQLSWYKNYKNHPYGIHHDRQDVPVLQIRDGRVCCVSDSVF